MAYADEYYPTDMGNSRRPYSGYTSFHFYKHTDDGKAYSGINTGLQPLQKTGIGIETDAQKKAETQVILF